MPLNPQHDYVHLAADGSATALPGGDAFWHLAAAESARYGAGWLVSEYEFVADWPTWEMHPEGDEFVYLLSGEVDLLLETPAGLQSVTLAGRGAVVVPRGVWHTAKVRVAPSRMLHVTRGGGTQVRPA
ncbi:cupin [Rhizobacter sp. Root404]|uniref:cupin n=1 Tax=Rhizobacter sp. Root404 TaxID=1736528 RepID=UPI0006F7D59C|nr:cupin [Rhizobacter sp. Root404]KQW40536.1 cupin [Rhizobacter sp. Root404]